MTPMTSEPVALLLNLEATSPKGAALHQLFAQAGVMVHDIEPAQLADPVGYLADLPGFSPAEEQYAGVIPTEEFVLLCHMPDENVMELVRAMRAGGCSVGCKATLTEHNRTWPFVRLVQEVSEEHAAMTQYRAQQ